MYRRGGRWLTLWMCGLPRLNMLDIYLNIWKPTDQPHATEYLIQKNVTENSPWERNCRRAIFPSSEEPFLWPGQWEEAIYTGCRRGVWDKRTHKAGMTLMKGCSIQSVEARCALTDVWTRFTRRWRITCLCQSFCSRKSHRLLRVRPQKWCPYSKSYYWYQDSYLAEL